MFVRCKKLQMRKRLQQYIAKKQKNVSINLAKSVFEDWHDICFEILTNEIPLQGGKING